MSKLEHYCWLLIIALLGGIFLQQLHADDIPTDPPRAHQWVDGILAPEFDAAYNRWRAKHPVDKKEGTWDHVFATDVGDRERGAAVLANLESLKRGMKRAGY